MIDYKSPSVTLDDIVFEGRNHSYGAYMIRKNYQRIVLRSLLIGGALFIVAFLFMQFVTTQEDTEEAVEVVADLANLPPPPPVDPNEPPPPPPPPAPPPPKVATIRFVEMEVVTAEEAVEPVTRVEETENKQIAMETQEGEETSVDLGLPESAPSVLSEGTGEEEQPFVAVEQMPEFPGGIAELGKYLQKNLRYPAQARNQNIQGKVFVSFVVGADGTIKDVTIAKGIGYGCDEEAKRVVSSMPKWKAGRQSGRSVPVRYSLPISFTLASQ
ncbi:TonB family protein [Xanthocytophaga agilis]|uniref:TonB family protein n=1 Tax=Xanthocytophaga agilis TaxID=3048010 RepID=A0AAE3R6I2_9BACT|nr:TonB family protein [Xanthocytophaga agilis]MDJ1502345.1 TonB family protein [Xanthocytophaga agilis]